MRKCLRYSLMVGAMVCLIVGLLQSLEYALLLSGVCLLLNNLIYCTENIYQRIVFLIFNCTFAVFLMGRPVIDMFRGNPLWNYEYEHVFFALISIVISLFCLFAGAMFADALHQKDICKGGKKESAAQKVYRERYRISLQDVSLALYWLTMVIYLITQLERLAYMQGRSYEEYYSTFSSSLPYIFDIMASFMRYSLCMFLATMPSKKRAFVPLAVYLLSAVPSLLIGIRNTIVLNAIFIFVYYFIRDALEDKEKWIGRLERLAVAVIVPVALVFLAAYNYLRAGTAIAVHGVWALLVDLFYKQGVSFWVLCIGHQAIPELPWHPFRNYTFGGIIDYFTHGTIAQKLFGAQSLGTGNNIIQATLGNSFSHSMSYVTRGDDYLAGMGWGSSYILEVFTDFGYIGLVIFNLILGFLLIYGIYWARKRHFAFTVFLLSITSIFFIPRAEATGWIEFLINIRFWVPVIFCYVAYTYIYSYGYKQLDPDYKRIKWKGSHYVSKIRIK